MEDITFHNKINQLSLHTRIINPKVESLKQWGNVGIQILNENWEEAYKLAINMWGASIVNMTLASSELKFLNSKLQILDFTSEKLEETPIYEILKDETKKKEIIENLKSKGFPPKIIKKVEELGNSNQEENWKYKISKIKDKLVEAYHSKLNYTIAQGLNGYWSCYHIAYNKHINSTNRFFISSEFKIVDKEIEKLDKEVSKRFLQLYSDFLNRDSNKLKHDSLIILFWLQENVDFLARISSILNKTLEKSLKKGKISPVFLGTLNLNAGVLARKCALLTALSLNSLKISLLPSNSTYVKEIFKKSRELKFGSSIPNGKDVDLRDLVENVDNYKESFIEVDGFIRNSKKWKTDDDKLISQFDIVHYSGEKSFPVIAIFEDLKHVGIVDGCCVNINGILKTNSAIFDKPHIQISRIKLSEYSSQSWYDYMLNELDKVFEYYPNSYHINWSIRPEDKKDEGQKSDKTGASEIIFKKKFGNKMIK